MDIVDKLMDAGARLDIMFDTSVGDHFREAAEEIGRSRLDREIALQQTRYFYNAFVGHSLSVEMQIEEINDRNKRVQSRYDELIKIGKHGHYETLFHIVREEVERALLIEAAPRSPRLIK